MTGEFANLPADLPRPVDDGAAAHLTGMSMPRLTLRSTAAALLLSEDGLAGAFYARWMGTQYPVLAAVSAPIAPTYDCCARRSAASSRSLPQNSSSPMVKDGAQNSPRDAASSV